MGYGSVDILSQDEILQKMIDLVVTRTQLTDLLPGSQLTQILSAAARSDEAIYFQIAKLVDAFSLESARGADLDLRLADYDLERQGAQYAVTTGNFLRSVTTGNLAIPAGTEVGTDNGQKFLTLTPISILAGNLSSAAVGLIAAEAGVDGNISAGSLTNVLTSFAGPESEGLTFSNSAAGTGGADQESDESARQRAVDKVLGLNRTSPRSLDAIARQVSVEATGESVVHTNLVESLVTPGRIDLWIDNGTGLTAVTDEVTAASPEVLLASAVGGESRFKVTNFPIARDGSDVPIITVELNAAALTLGTDYYVKSGSGDIVLNEFLYPTGLTAGDSLEAYYTYSTGLVAEVQWTLDGLSSDPDNYVGGVAAGADLIVRTPSRVLPSLELTAVVASGFDPVSVKEAYKNLVISTINQLDIGQDVILSTIIDLKGEIDGLLDVFFNVPAPSDPPANIILSDDQIARATTSSVVVN